MRVANAAIAVLGTLLAAGQSAAGQTGSASQGHVTRRVIAIRARPSSAFLDPLSRPTVSSNSADESPGDCISGPLEQTRFNATPARLSELDGNRYVNRTVQPITDLEHYGVAEYWTLPKDGKGDCGLRSFEAALAA